MEPVKLTQNHPSRYSRFHPTQTFASRNEVAFSKRRQQNVASGKCELSAGTGMHRNIPEDAGYRHFAPASLC